ncbi:MAG: diacylglycerol kinase family lipid kinase [Prevotellaceae bacterium]|jgi:diacylglycerol kinase (ATP)|nr:diacylglycerol kinase family lipid kinase [Prevotellaceae bacterium]
MNNTILDVHWGVVVNSHAGRRVLGKNYSKIDNFFSEIGIKITKVLTEYRGHAVEIAKNLAEKGIRHFFIVGGDGTVNEVVNGIYTSQIADKESVTLAVLPYGSGNDWARYWKLSKKVGALNNLFRNGKSVNVDVGKLTYKNLENEDSVRYFMNGAGLGFDGKVVQITNKLKKYFGGSSFAYTFSVLIAVFVTASQSMILKGDYEVEHKIFSVAIGNGCFSGGGIKQVPKADPTDGLLHVTAVKQPSFLKILSGLKYLFQGRIDEHELVYSFETECFTAKTESLVAIETDGVEIAGKSPITAEILPKGLKMLTK